MQNAIEKKKTKPITKKPTPQEIQEIFSHVESQDFELSCCHLIQGVDSGNFRGMEAGDWVESTTGEKATGRKFLYVQSYKERVVWWGRENSKGAKGLHSRFGANEKVPQEILINLDLEVQDTLNMFVLLDDERIPAVIRMKRTALKAGRSINSAEHRRMMNGKPGGVYILQADVKTGGGYTWFVPLFENVGDATPEQMKRVTDAREFLRTTQARVIEADGTIDRPHVPTTNGGKLSESHRAAQVATASVHPDVDDDSIPF